MGVADAFTAILDEIAAAKAAVPHPIRGTVTSADPLTVVLDDDPEGEPREVTDDAAGVWAVDDVVWRELRGTDLVVTTAPTSMAKLREDADDLRVEVDQHTLYNAELADFVTTQVAFAEAASERLDGLDGRTDAAQQKADDAAAEAEAAKSGVLANMNAINTVATAASDAWNAAVAAQAEADQLLAGAANQCANSSFELGLDDWTAVTTGATSAAAPASDAPDGATVLRLTATSGTFAGGRWSKRVLSEPNRRWRIRARARVVGSPPAAGYAYLALRRHLAAGGSSDTTVRLFGPGGTAWSTDWTILEGEALTTATTIGVSAMLLLHGTTTTGAQVEFDVVELRDVTEVVAAQAAADSAATAAATAQATAVAAQNTANTATTAATTAQTTADGKNRINRSTATPSGSGHKPGDVWWRFTNPEFTGPIIGKWTYSGTAWAASTIGSEIIEALTVDKLSVTGNAKIPVAVLDVLVNDQAFLNRVSVAQSLLVGGWQDNLFPWAWGAAGGADLWPASVTWSTTSPPPDLPGYLLTAPGTLTISTAIATSNARLVPVTPGEQIVFEVWLRADIANTKLYIEARNQAGSLPAASAWSVQIGANAGHLVADLTVPTAWTRYETVFTVPAGWSGMYMAPHYFNHSNSSIRTAAIGFAYRARRKTGTILLEKSSVIAEHLVASVELSAKVAEFLDVSAERVFVGGRPILDEIGDLSDSTASSLADGLDALDAAATDRLDNAIAGVTGQLAQLDAWRESLDNYVLIDGGGIFIGNRTDDFRVNINSSRMSFIEGDKEVAYVSNQALFIGDATITGTLTQGGFYWETQTSGRLDFKWGG